MNTQTGQITTEEQLFEAGLKKTLPSTELRKIHTLARAGNN